MDLEDCLAAIRGEVACVLAEDTFDSANDDSSWEEIGLDSLSGIELLARMRDKYGLELSFTILIEASTIRGLAELVCTSRLASQ